MSGLRKPAEIFRIPAALASIAMSLAAGPPAQAQQSPAVLFQNVRIFDGKNGALSPPSNVLVRDNRIEKISAATITADAQVINGGGRVLMPGLIDAHWHAMLVRPTPASALANDVGYTNLLAAAEATSTLMRGFTTVRDMGGPAFALKRAIDEGLVAGPRIYPSGAIITITSGHGDFRQLSDLPRTIGGMLSRMEKIGGSMVADSPDEVRVRAREQLMQGATQVKLTAGGGVASPFSPLDVSTFTEPELRAAVEAADNWGTYVATHAYTPASIQRSIAAGVRCIEHGHLMDDFDPAVDRGGSQMHRARAPDGRRHRPSHGRKRHLVEHATVPRCGDRKRPRARGAGQDAASRFRHRQGLCAGKEIRDQDRIRHRRPVRAGAGGTARRHAGQPYPLV